MSPFTPNESLSLAFDDSLIPFSVQSTLPPTLHLRPLSSSDYARGHLTLLATLTVCPDIGPTAWSTRYSEIVALTGTYYPLVIVDKETDDLVATGSLVIERKFIRGAGLTGHIEDIAVSDKMQGKGLGKKLIEALSAVSEAVGAYKVRAGAGAREERTRFGACMGNEETEQELTRCVRVCRLFWTATPRTKVRYDATAVLPRGELTSASRSAAFYVKCGYVASEKSVDRRYSDTSLADTRTRASKWRGITTSERALRAPVSS